MEDVNGPVLEIQDVVLLHTVNNGEMMDVKGNPKKKYQIHKGRGRPC
jgi:hypothetical protein